MKLSAIIIIISLAYQINAQIKSAGDFKISTDNTPSTIIQNNPKIFCNDTLEFITTWRDYRDGEPSVYAQRFNSEGSKVGTNFKIDSDPDIRFLPDGSYIVFTEQYNYYYFCCDNYELYGRIHFKNENKTERFRIAVAGLGCDIGCTGNDFDMISKADTILLFARNEGYVSLKKIDMNGNVIHVEDSSEVLPIGASSISTAINKNNNYILNWFNYHYWPYEPGDSLKFGIYVTFFSSSDSVIIKNALIKSFDYYGSEYYDKPPLIKTISISDSLFEIFWVDRDSLTFNYQKYDENATPLDSVKTIKLPFEELPINWYREVTNFTFSPLKDGSFAVFISSREIGYKTPVKFYNSVFYFDSDGNLLDEHFSNSEFPNLSKQIFKTGGNSFFTVNTDEQDIYLLSLSDITIEDSFKINDDLIGSNELNPYLSKIDNQLNLISWVNENDSLSQQVDLNGNLIGATVDLKGTKIIFSINGKSLNIWKKEINPNLAYLGLTIYDEKWNILFEDSLTSSNDVYILDSDICQLSDSLFVMFYKNRSQLSVRTLNLNFELMNEIVIAEEYIHPIKIFKENSTSFWISSQNSVQLFSSALEPIGQKHFPFYTKLYFGDNKFLYVDYDYLYNAFPSRRLYGDIFTINKDTLIKKFYIAGNVDEYKLSLLPNNDFLVVFRQGNSIYSRAFSQEGKAKTDSFLIHDDIISLKKNPSVLYNSNKLFFTWSDARNTGKGYDIYGSIFDYGSVVEVEQNETIKSFNLYQNYPNPFNPSTVISYTIPEQTKVQIIVIDILGKEIKSLINEVKPPGKYEVVFNASGLPSGIYFYRINAGSFTQTKKFLLLK